MRRFFLLLATIALGLVIACGGGDDDDNGDDDGGSSEPTATASPSSDGGGDDDGDRDDDGGRDDNGGGISGDFCSPDNVDQIFESVDFTDIDDLESEFNRLEDALDFWQDSAPNEIEDDVDTVVDALRGLIELLEENDFNFLAIGAAAQDDPRFLALDSQEFQDASDRIAEYCGIDIDTSPSGGFGGGTGSNGGSTGGGFSVELPEDFPEELIAPDSTIGFAGDVGIGLTVEMTSTATTGEVKAYYEDVLGDPTFQDNESVTWSVFDDNGALTTVSLTGTDGNVTILIILASS